MAHPGNNMWSSKHSSSKQTGWSKSKTWTRIKDLVSVLFPSISSLFTLVYFSWCWLSCTCLCSGSFLNMIRTIKILMVWIQRMISHFLSDWLLETWDSLARSVKFSQWLKLQMITRQNFDASQVCWPILLTSELWPRLKIKTNAAKSKATSAQSIWSIKVRKVSTVFSRISARERTVVYFPILTSSFREKVMLKKCTLV